MKRLFLFFVFNSVMSALLLGQYRVIDETVSGTKYTVVLQNGGMDLAAQESMEELRGGEWNSDIIIAIPAGTRPAVTSHVLEMRNMSTQGAAGTEFRTTVKGYLWVGNSYCIHLSVPRVLTDLKTLVRNEIVRFQIILTFDRPIPMTRTAHSAFVHPGILNSKYGATWTTSHPKLDIPQTDSWIDYSQQYVKLGTMKDGIVRIGVSELTAYGVPIGSIDPAAIKLYNKGKEVPIYVYGQQDGSFNTGDYIEFLGQRNYGDPRYREIAPTDSSYYEYLDRYSDTTIYWMRWTGPAGKRIDTVQGYLSGQSDTIRYYDHLLHFERDYYWDFALSGGDLRKNYPEILENETWNDNPVGVGRSPVTFSVSDIVPNRAARAFIKLQDYASSLTAGAHNVAISINNGAVRYDSGRFDKFQVKVLKAQFSSSVLSNGNNTVDLHSFTVTGNTINTVIRDWTELEYPRILRTTTDSLVFGYQNIVTPTRSMVIVTGLSPNAVSLYRHDRASGSIVKIMNYIRSNDTLKFIDSVSNNIYYYLLRESKITPPVFFYKKLFANLRNSTNAAEYIAITHPVFKSQAESYTAFIETQYDVSTKLVDINDIYDEFNYGYFSPVPIKEFLKSTHLYWQSPKPKHVFLIGKGTYDYYGNKTRYFGVPRTVNYIPPFGNPVSDIWFVMWDSTGSLIPQMNIGRLPAKNVEEFQHYFLKHQKYVSKGFDEWNKRYLFFSGGNITDQNQLAQSKGVNDFIINNYILPAPIGGAVANFYKTPAPNVTNFGPYSPEYVKTSIDNGGVFISYIGHSGTQTWDNSITDITQLSNIRDRNPMISDFGCSTGKFAEPDITSFSENAVNNVKGQAISYIGNSSLGFTSTAYTFPQIFYRKMLVDTNATLGDIHRLAKIEYMKQYGSSGSFGLFLKTNTLIGDPIITLPIPVKPNISLTNAQVTVVPDRPTDQDDSARFLIRYNNFGLVKNDSVEFAFTLLYQGVISRTIVMKRKIPRFTDTLQFSIPIEGNPGLYELLVHCDPSNSYDELDENDNSMTYQLVVASTKIKNLMLSPLLHQQSSDILYLNPSVDPGSSHFFLDISTNPMFTSSTSIQQNYNPFFTKVPLSNSFIGKRIWVRSRLEPTASPGLPISFILGPDEKIQIGDSTAFSTLDMKNLKVLHSSIVLDTARTEFSSISGGFNDGNTAVIMKNGENYVPENTLRGFHVCIFDSATYDFRWYYRFDVQSGASVATNFKTMLDTLSTGYIVIIAIANDVASNPANFPATLKTTLRNYGSRYIDSVGIADSWTLIGKKGAMKGSVPERFSRRYVYGGPIRIDTTIIVPNTHGTFITSRLGPVQSWKSIENVFQTPYSSSISLGLIGVTWQNNTDTLWRGRSIGSLISLDTVNASQYPYLRFFGEMNAGISNASPVLTSIAVTFNQLPELGTNYQVFKAYHPNSNTEWIEFASTDSIVQGTQIQFRFRIYNAGGSTARQVKYRLTSIWDNNYVETLADGIIDSITAASFSEIIAPYSTSLGSGRRTIQLTIDPDSTIREMFRDNNVYTFPLIVKKSSGNPLLPNLSIGKDAVTSVPPVITDETDTARFTIVYSNTGGLVNDSVSILVKHIYQSATLRDYLVRRKYPVSYDTIRIGVPIAKRGGAHQLSVELDHTGLILESSEGDNRTDYLFTVVTTAFKAIFPTSTSLAYVDRIIFLNPTAGIAPGTPVSLQLDTLPGFPSPASFTASMQQFSTSILLPGLRRSQRYFWRVKSSTMQEWSTGSFYSGDTTIAAIGQLDSVSWTANTFVRTRFHPDSGARIIDSRYAITVSSAGFNDGNTGSVLVNGVNVLTPILGSGHHLLVLDPVTYEPVSARRFDLAADAAQADSLTQFIAAVPTGRIVIDVVVDEGSNNLQSSTRAALKSIGSAFIDQLSFRDSWAIIGRKGAAAGTVPEQRKGRGTGFAAVETTIISPEYTGTITTPLIGPFNKLSDLRLDAQIPSGSHLSVKFIALSPSGSMDTLVSVVDQVVIPLSAVDTRKYRNGKILFTLSSAGTSERMLRRRANSVSPIIYGWTLVASTSVELAASSASTVIDKDQVMEGEHITFSGKVFNVSMTSAETVLVRLTTNASGLEHILNERRYATIGAGDSIIFTYQYDTRGKRGNHVFSFTVDPLDSLSELTRENNTVSIPYTVSADTLRPVIQVTFDGLPVLNGDLVAQRPLVLMRFTDNNPSAILPADTTNFFIRLNNKSVPFTEGTAQLLPSSTTGKAEVRWTPDLPGGENIITFSARDVSGNGSDTIVLFLNTATSLGLLDVFNIPNPFHSSTSFTYTISAPTVPDEVTIAIYTVAGRMVRQFTVPGIIGFNKVMWDGRDNDGDELGNGVYFYKVTVKQGGTQVEGISKLVKMR